MNLEETYCSLEQSVPKKGTEEYTTEFIFTWDRFGEYPIGAHMIQHVAKLAFEKFSCNISILDVGCGKCKTFLNLLWGIPSKTPITYHSIDKKACPIQSPNQYLTMIHHQGCAFEEDTYKNIPKNAFNILVMDIEPHHGHEIKLFKRCEEFLQDDFIVIFKCIRQMDMWGNALGVGVMKFMYKHVNVMDTFHRPKDYDMMFRDVIAICSKKEKQDEPV